MTSLFDDKYKAEPYALCLMDCFAAVTEGALPGQTDAHHAVMLYLTRGSGTLTVKGNPLTLKPGQLALINANTPWSAELNGRALCVSFSFEPGEGQGPNTRSLYNHGGENIRRVMDAGAACFLLRDSHDLVQGLLAELILLWESGQGSGAAAAVTLALTLLTVADLVYKQRVSGDVIGIAYVRQASRYIEEQYAADGLNVRRIAEHVHVHPSYLHRLFTDIKGITLNAYINQIRMEKAKELLQNTDFSIMDVSISVGINSQQYFTHLFKRYTGQTPLVYRNGAQRE